MTPEEILSALAVVRSEEDLNAKALLLAGLVSELFRERGFEPVIVGGSAIEFYTDGAYMSGDTDICWAGDTQPTLNERTEIMRQIPGIISHGGGKSWQCEGLWIDLLGEVNYVARKTFVKLVTAAGRVLLIPAEDALVGRVFTARCWTGYNAQDDECARKMMAAVLRGQIPFDWDEAYRVAASPKYSCVVVLNEVRSDVEKALASGYIEG